MPGSPVLGLECLFYYTTDVEGATADWQKLGLVATRAYYTNKGKLVELTTSPPKRHSLFALNDERPIIVVHDIPDLSFTGENRCGVPMFRVPLLQKFLKELPTGRRFVSEDELTLSAVVESPSGIGVPVVDLLYLPSHLTN